MLYDLKKFPQKKRTFPAGFLSSIDFQKGGKVFFLVIVILILAGILRSFSFPSFSPQITHPLYPSLISEFEQIKAKVLQDPKNPFLHLKLASIYQEANDFKKAAKEIDLARRYSQNSEEINNLFKKLEEFKTEPEKIEEEIKKWQKLSEERPGYRDAYFKIGVLNYQLSQNNEALEAIDKALELDPNFEPAKRLKQFLLP